MPDKIYKGKNIRLILDEKKVFHATECGISISVNLESIATKDTDGNVSTPGAYEWSASLSALVADPDNTNTTHHGFNEVVQKMLAREECLFQYTTEETGDFIYSGSVYITSADISASTEGAATGNFAFTGNGNLTLATVTP